MPPPPGCLLGFLANLRRFLNNNAADGSADALPGVMAKKRFVTDAEANFFRVLKAVVGPHGHGLGQVSLRHLLWFPPNDLCRAGRVPAERVGLDGTRVGSESRRGWCAGYARLRVVAGFDPVKVCGRELWLGGISSRPT